MEPGGEDAGKKKSKIKRAWGYYRWYDRISGSNDWYNWLASFLKTKAGAAVAIGSTAAVTTATAIVVNNAMQAPPPPPAPVEVAAPAPPPPAPEPVRQTQGTLIYAIEGKDKAGRRGTFDVVVAKKEFLWVRKSSEEIEKDGKSIPGADIANQVLDDDVKAALGSAREIIAVGTASQEGNAKEETERADKRAKKTAEIVVSGVAPTVPIWTLNLGQYREPGKDGEASGTNWQRPFMVIAVKDLEADSNIGEALADALRGQNKLPTPTSYSAFELTKFR